MTPKEALIEARRLLAEKGWCQKEYAKEGGTGVGVHNPAADSYCSLGALSKVCFGTGMYSTVRTVLSVESYDFTSKAGAPSIVEYNDAKGRTKEEVLAMFDHVIGKLP